MFDGILDMDTIRVYITCKRPGIRGTQVNHLCGWKKMQESSKCLFWGNLIPEIESKVPNESSDITFEWIGPQPHRRAFLLEPLHPRCLGWMILSECHESPAHARISIRCSIQYRLVLIQTISPTHTKILSPWHAQQISIFDWYHNFKGSLIPCIHLYMDPTLVTYLLTFVLTQDFANR